MVYCRKMIPYSLYVHIPFCRHRCCYCDFNTYAGIDDLIPAYVDGLCREIELLGEAAGERLPVHTVFFGGGTPSLLAATFLERIMSALHVAFNLLPGLETTIEANPGSLSLVYLQELHDIGINRLSIGMQSAQPEELHLLERQHDYEDVVKSVKWARQAGFRNLNLDLIFGLPQQDLPAWNQNLTLALNLRPEHLSLYALTLEHGTPMAHWVGHGLLPDIDSDLSAEMYELADQRLVEAGFVQYEISNWARLDGERDLLACRHNLQYWRNLPYLGLGAGAHGFAASVRTANILSPAAYAQRCLKGIRGHFPVTPATVNTQPIDQVTEMGETMMMSLRLTQEGVSRKDFSNRFGRPVEEVYGGEIERLVRLGLLEQSGEDGDILRLTPAGRLLGNQVFMQFV